MHKHLRSLEGFGPDCTGCEKIRKAWMNQT